MYALGIVTLRTQAQRIFRSSSAAPALFLISIAITLVFWLILPAAFSINESSDYKDFYEPVARNILGGWGITLDDEPATRTPPGYPLLLAGLFGLADTLGLSERTVLSAFNLLCVGLASVFILLLAQSIWGPLPSLLSAIAWMTYPFTLWLTKQPNSELPFLVTLYGGLILCWYALRGHGRAQLLYFASGLLFGLTMLIRPIAIGAGIALCLIVWLVAHNVPARLRLLYVGMVLLGNLIAVLPWQLWTYSQTGRVIFLSTADASSALGGLTFAVDLRGYRRPVAVPDDVRDLMQEIGARRDEMQSLSGIAAVMIEELQSRPLATAKLLAIKAVRVWYGTDSRRFEFAIILVQLPYLVLMLWSTRQAWKLGGPPKKLALSIWILVLYFWVMTMAVVPLLRYMTPVVGLLFVLLPASLASATNRRTLPTRD